MSNVVFSAKTRMDFGSAKSVRLRKQGRVPGIIYGKGAAVAIDLDGRELSAHLRTISESTIVKIDVDGKTHDAFVKSTQRNIQDGNILHVDFYEIEMGKLLRARVSVHITGNPIGVRDGGILETPLHDIEVECFPKDLPERINIDISNLGVNQSIHVRDLALGNGVKLISAEDQVVALVKFAKSEAESAGEGEEAAATEAATPAKDTKSGEKS
ncbi:MAG: 50S ribosomal protein L25 [Spirochaetaceae bacterium]|jgi:large subunit ribosomal protein L25|nr:50S ribosomal protein L25 [Spirochaetaceae bacterium]